MAAAVMRIGIDAASWAAGNAATPGSISASAASIAVCAWAAFPSHRVLDNRK